MDDKDSNKSIWKQPLGEVMRKELTVPEILKTEMRDLPISDFWKKEIHLRKQTNDLDEEVEQIRCYSCGKDTPATVSKCLHCEAPLEVEYKRIQAQERAEPEDTDEVSVSIIDAWDD